MSPEPHWTLVVVILLVSGLSGALLVRWSIAQTCRACGHGRSTHRVGGHVCDGLIGDWATCDCESFVPPAAPRRPVARKNRPTADRPLRKAS
jgi:hypothetical protein